MSLSLIVNSADNLILLRALATLADKTKSMDEEGNAHKVVLSLMNNDTIYIISGSLEDIIPTNAVFSTHNLVVMKTVGAPSMLVKDINVTRNNQVLLDPEIAQLFTDDYPGVQLIAQNNFFVVEEYLDSFKAYYNELGDRAKQILSSQHQIFRSVTPKVQDMTGICCVLAKAEGYDDRYFYATFMRDGWKSYTRSVSHLEYYQLSKFQDYERKSHGTRHGIPAIVNVSNNMVEVGSSLIAQNVSKPNRIIDVNTDVNIFNSVVLTSTSESGLNEESESTNPSDSDYELIQYNELPKKEVFIRPSMLNLNFKNEIHAKLIDIQDSKVEWYNIFNKDLNELNDVYHKVKGSVTFEGTIFHFSTLINKHDVMEYNIYYRNITSVANLVRRVIYTSISILEKIKMIDSYKAVFTDRNVTFVSIPKDTRKLFINIPTWNDVKALSVVADQVFIFRDLLVEWNSMNVDMMLSYGLNDFPEGLLISIGTISWNNRKLLIQLSNINYISNKELVLIIICFRLFGYTDSIFGKNTVTNTSISFFTGLLLYRFFSIYSSSLSLINDDLFGNFALPTVLSDEEQLMLFALYVNTRVIR